MRAMYTVQFSDLQIFQRRQCMDADTTSTISFYGVWLQIIIMMPGQKCNTLSFSLLQTPFFHIGYANSRRSNQYTHTPKHIACNAYQEILQHIFGIYALHFPSIADFICTWIWAIVNVEIRCAFAIAAAATTTKTFVHCAIHSHI